MRPRMLGEDLQDDLGPVEHTRFELELEVALLARAQVLVANDEVELTLRSHVAQRLHLAHAEEVGRVDLGPTLHVRAHDFGPGRARQVGQLGHLIPDGFGAGTKKEHPYEVCPLFGQAGRDQIASFLRRVMASSIRASGAVTESRK